MIATRQRELSRAIWTIGKHLSFLSRLENIIFAGIWPASTPAQHSADGPRMPKSSNAIYLLFEQWECLRVTKLFSWARRRNSSQPGSKLLKATRDSLESFVAEYSHPHHRWLDRCDSKISSYPYLLLSCNLPFDLWQYQYHYWSGRHWTNIVIISLLWGAAGGGTGGHGTQDMPGSPGSWYRAKGKWQLKHWHDSLVNTRNESTGIILCVLKICLGDEHFRDIHDDDNVSFLSHKPEGSECLK